MHETPSPSTIRAMFARIRPRYDLMNTLMTFGRDTAWRRACVSAAALPPHGRLLDVATGTGAVAAQAMAHRPDATVVGVDFCHDMLACTSNASSSRRSHRALADALALPFADTSFDAVISAFLLRNVPQKKRAFAEQVRVVRPGGRVVCLDTSPPPSHPCRPLVLFHLKVVIPLLARLVSGDAGAYSYLTRSTRHFLAAEELARVMAQAGLVNVTVRRFMWGAIALHVGVRPPAETDHE